jgi:hypothetical protein
MTPKSKLWPTVLPSCRPNRRWTSYWACWSAPRMKWTDYKQSLTPHSNSLTPESKARPNAKPMRGKPSAARSASSAARSRPMDDPELFSILTDAAHGLDPAIGWEAVHAHMLGIAAERDRLRLVVERAHDRVGADEQVLRTLGIDGLIALVAVLRQDCRDAMIERDQLRNTIDSQAADRLGEDAPPPAQRILADYARDLEAERDRLRAVVAAVVRQFDGLDDLWGETVKLNVEDLLALRHQAQAALDVSQATDGQ